MNVTKAVHVFRCPHKCQHPFQDQRYGPGMRVYIPVEKNSRIVKRCTVCGKEE